MGNFAGRTIARILVASLAVVGLAAVVAWAVRPAALPAPSWTAQYDVTARQPELIPPGTLVGQTAPDGWSHLVIKSLPRVRPADRPRMAAMTADMAAWMFTAFVVDVRPESLGGQTRFRLASIALGLGTAVNGRDTIITPETAHTHGVKLDWVTRTILTKGHEIQSLAMVVVHGPTFALVDTPVWFRCGEKNRLIRFRYALLVDGSSGRLDVLVWTIDTDGNCGDPGSIVELAADTINKAELIPDWSKFALGMTTADDSFGVDQLPPHRSRKTLSPGLRGLTDRNRFTIDEASTLEAGLRQILGHSPTP